MKNKEGKTVCQTIIAAVLITFQVRFTMQQEINYMWKKVNINKPTTDDWQQVKKKMAKIEKLILGYIKLLLSNLFNYSFFSLRKSIDLWYNGDTNFRRLELWLTLLCTGRIVPVILIQLSGKNILSRLSGTK